MWIRDSRESMILQVVGVKVATQGYDDEKEEDIFSLYGILPSGAEVLIRERISPDEVDEFLDQFWSECRSNNHFNITCI